MSSGAKNVFLINVLCLKTLSAMASGRPIKDLREKLSWMVRRRRLHDCCRLALNIEVVAAAAVVVPGTAATRKSQVC